MPRVLAAIGPESLGELLTEIALEHWPAAAVGDVLPALHVLDPEEADEPAVAIALDRAGSWPGLLALTSRELVDQPFIQARPVLNTLFSAVLVRLAHPHGDPASAPAAPLYAAGEAEPAAAAPERVGAGEEELPPPVAAQHGAESAEEPAREPEDAQEAAEEHHAAPEAAEADPEIGPELEAEHAHEAADEAGDEAEHAAEAVGEVERGVEPAEIAEPVEPVAEHRAEGAAQAAYAGDALDADYREPYEPPHEAQPREDAPREDAGRDEAVLHQESATLDEEEPEEAERVLDADAEPVADEAAEPEPEPVLDAADEPAPEPAAEEAEAVQAAYEQEPEERKRSLPDLIEAAFAGLDDKSWAVAQNRVFTDEPSAVDQLAKLFAVPPAEIIATESELRDRLDRWLASDEAAPYRAHLEELVRTLGPDAPKEQVIDAADWHKVEIQALEVPAWQFVLTTLAPPPPPPPVPVPVQQELPPPPLPQRKPYQQQPQPPVELVPSAFGPVGLTPSPPPGPPQFQAFTPVVPPVQEVNGEQEQPFQQPPPVGEQEQPYQPLKDVSQTQRCFRQPDGRWWLRIDVTAEQLAGGECVLPTGFASYLGLSPGESRTVRSAAGELTMTWHGRPTLLSIERLLVDVGAREGGHLFLTLSDEGVLRARHLPVAAQGAEKITKALRLVGYTAPGGTRDQAARVIATRIGMAGPVVLPDLLDRLRERGDRDLLELLD
ncbi:unnamed protein product [[Actinomadura] parvosata subsp. kistnae]|uniref:Uncharacterized protein n=1 Tax=[Actinomadura] parvosata subsp. kistnae TaxID=1909395 RepID=A0A1V0AFJ0_9ACTN|nr:hypothetical protein [Nonomuraea sp. ATCC 55076]AQZ68852.1 hypothetical protein BKM31_51855 [Nonomuraea sp. ATCC 55076]SPL92626.1 unnamed protein product [Actinomadura parvosata subsp. kistnae]